MAWLLLLVLDFGWAQAKLDLNAAKQSMAAKNYDQVIESISPHLDKASKEAFMILSKAYLEKKNLVLAQKTLALAQTRNPQDPEIPTELGRLLIQMNKDREAKNILNEVLDAHPKYEPAYLVMADIFERRKNRYELRLLYQDLIERTSEKPAYLTKLCEITTMEGLYDLSFSYCKKAIEKNQKEPMNYVHLASAFRETGNPIEANANYKKAADSFAKSEPSQHAYAQYLDEQKNYVESFKYYKRCSEADPKSTRCWLGLGFSGIEVQKFDDSVKAFQSLCEIDRNGAKQARRAAGIVKAMQQDGLMKKYEDLIRFCEGLLPSRSL